jgi:hypothetical protein
MTQPAQPERDHEGPETDKRPEHKIRYGRVEVAIWKRESGENTWHAFTVSRSYRDKDQQWQRSNSLDEEDLLPAAKALEEAYSWVQAQRQAARDQAFRELRAPAAGEVEQPRGTRPKRGS